MSETVSKGQLILVPAIITLVVTIIRLVGELQHWPKPWFNPQSAIVGITWLAPVFGIYFAWRLAGAGEPPRSAWGAFGWSLGAVVVAVALLVVVQKFRILTGDIPLIIFVSVLSCVAALASLKAWSALGWTLLAYAYAARVPVVIIMFFAFRGKWGTHYDDVVKSMADASLLTKFFWLSVIPQFFFWMGFTVLFGALFGSLVVAIARRGKSATQAA